jgi:hypothetical protein
MRVFAPSFFINIFKNSFLYKMLAKDVRALLEAYGEIYSNNNSKQSSINEEVDNVIEEILEELIEECMEFGYTLDEAAELVEESAIEYLTELNPYAAAGSKESRAYNKATTSTKRGAERKAAVKAAVSKVKQKAAGAAVDAYAAGRAAKDAVGSAANAAQTGARRAAGAVSTAASSAKKTIKGGIKRALGGGLRAIANRAGKVASRLGESSINEEPSLGAIKSAMAPKRSAENAAGMRGPELTHGAKPAPSAGAGSATSGSVVTQPRSREFSHGSRPLKNVLKGGLTMSYAPDGEMVDEAKAVGKARSTDQNPKGAGARVSSGRGMTMTKAGGLGKDKTFKNNPDGDDMVKSQYDAQAKADRQAAAKERASSGEDRVGKLIRSVQKSHYEPDDIYDLVMEYLLSTGHAESISEAQYIMLEMDEKFIEMIVEGLVTGAANAINTALKPTNQTPQQGKAAVGNITRGLDVVAKPIKSILSPADNSQKAQQQRIDKYRP